MLIGVKQDDGIHVKIIGETDFNTGLESVKQWKGTFDWKTKEWLFPCAKEEELKSYGVKFSMTAMDMEYPVAYVNKARAPFLREYQYPPLQYMLSHNGRILLADDVGLGKTLSSIGFFAYTKLNYPVLIVVPASMKTQWQEQCLRFDIGGKTVKILDGIQAIGKADTDITILNYDLLSRHMTNTSKNKWKPQYEASEQLQQLKESGFEGLILDECHRLKSDTAMWTQAVRYLSEGIPHILALSATPIENKPMEFFNILNILRPDLWFDRDMFGMRYCNGHTAYRWIRYGKKKVKQAYMDYNGASNQEELFTVLRHHVMFRRNKHEAIPGLPKAVPMILPLTMTVAEQKEYWEIANGEKAILTLAGKKMRDDQQMTKDNYLKQFSAGLKMDYIIQFLTDFLEDTEDKLMIITEHHFVLDAIMAQFKKYSVMYDGRCTSKQKDAAKKEFIEGDARFIVGQIKSLGEGIDGLQKICHKMMIVELPYNPMRLYQTIGRLERDGSTSDTVLVYFPVLKDTIEEHVVEMITDKTANVFSILDGKEANMQNIGKQISDYLHTFGIDTN
jgi:SWI/SNF-related matrix-associated actin-dependent regulator 1 of chromatin subfamily A